MKWLFLLLLLLAAGFFAFRMSRTSVVGEREAEACTHIERVCGEHYGADGRERCEQGLAELRTSSGASGADRALGCVEESGDCAGAMGCLAGAGLNKAVNVGKSFFDGIMKSLRN